MAEYFNLINDNQKVVIDDQFMSPMLVHRGVDSTDWAQPGDYLPYYAWWPWGVEHVIAESDTIAGLGLNLGIEDQRKDINYDSRNDPRLIKMMYAVKWATSLFVVAQRAEVIGLGTNAKFTIRADWVDNNYNRLKFRMGVILYSGAQYTKVEYALYCMRPSILNTSNSGLIIKNEKGELIFDAFRGVFSVIGTMYGGVNPRNQIAAAYQMPIPAGLNKSNVFITCRSGMPCYSAYHITNRGVSWDTSAYETRLSFPGNNVRVELHRQKHVAGKNNSYAYGGFYENVIYVPQPRGNYLDTSKTFK